MIHDIYVTVQFFTNSSFTICLGNLCLDHDCKDLTNYNLYPNLSHLKNKQYKHYNVMAMAFNTTFNNISAMSRRSVLFLVPRVPRENRQPAASE